MDVQQFLAQQAPWGLTFGQTGAVGVVAVILLVGWVFVRVVLRLGGFLFRMGCAALVIFICGAIGFIALYNLASR